MLTFEILSNGNLQVTADNPAEIQELIDDGKGYSDIMPALFEDEVCNGGFHNFNGEDGNPYTGLNDFPWIAEGMDINDDGEQTIIGRAWYFADNYTQLETEMWANGEPVVYTLHEL